MAGNLNSYATGDVLICFRNGGSDLVVDAGPVSTFTNTTPGQVISISQYTTTQLAQLGVDGLNWSAFTYLSDNTLFVSQARTDLNTQTSPWQAAPSSTQSGTALRIATIPPGANANASFNALNSATAIIEPDNSTHTQNANYPQGQSYENSLFGSYGGFFNGNFTPSTSGGNGILENTTSGTFDTDGVTVRSDFYQVKPSSSAYVPSYGKYLGYFELSPNGAMTFTAPSGTVSTPVIQSINRSGTQTTINYTTGVIGTYTLRKNSLLNSGVPRASWTSVSTLASGDTSTHSITFTDTASNDFYVITAQ